MSLTKNSVVIVDDDPDFIEVIKVILESEGSWEVVSTFNSLESFVSWCGAHHHDPQSNCPDILIIDVFASNAANSEAFPLTGFHVALALRDLGLHFGTVIASSMSSPSLISLAQARHPDGWSYLTKSSDLVTHDILNAVQMALIP
jgi:DNA-binding NarL/FixJ family response regulator